VVPSGGWEFFSSPLNQVWGPPSLLSSGYWGLFPQGIKYLEHETDHSPPSSVEINECVTLDLYLQYAFMVWCLVKDRNNFTLIMKFISMTFLNIFSPFTNRYNKRLCLSL